MKNKLNKKSLVKNWKMILDVVLISFSLIFLVSALSDSDNVSFVVVINLSERERKGGTL